MKHAIYLCILLLAFVPAFAAHDDDDDYAAYAVLHSANDATGIVFRDTEDEYPVQIRSLNKMELSSKWFGIAGEYNYLNQSNVTKDETDTSDLRSYAFGAGMPNPDFFRAFAKYHVCKIKWYEGEQQDNTAFSLELAKRYRSLNMIAELKGRYFTLIKEKEGDKLFADYDFENIYNPHQTLELETYLSSAYDLKLNPAQDCGIAPSGSSPFLLVNHAAGGIFGKFSQITPKENGSDFISTKAMIAVNASRWFGMDIHHEYEHHKGGEDFNSLGVRVRPTMFILGPIRFTFLIDPQMDLAKHEDSELPKYTLDGGAILYLLVKNYSNLWVKGYAYNNWDPQSDVLKIDYTSYRISSGINIRF